MCGFLSEQLSLLYCLANYIQSDIPSMLSDLNQKKDTLTFQLGKLQKDCRDMQTKEKDAMRDVSRMKEQMDSVLKES